MRTHTQKRQAGSALLVSRARRMLHAPTPSEEALWLALRGGALGVPFKRQVVVGGRYIVDLFAPSVGLVVEVDGGVHRGRRAADRRREDWLLRRGYGRPPCECWRHHAQSQTATPSSCKSGLRPCSQDVARSNAVGGCAGARAARRGGRRGVQAVGGAGRALHRGFLRAVGWARR